MPRRAFTGDDIRLTDWLLSPLAVVYIAAAIIFWAVWDDPLDLCLRS